MSLIPFCRFIFLFIYFSSKFLEVFPLILVFLIILVQSFFFLLLMLTSLNVALVPCFLISLFLISLVLGFFLLLCCLLIKELEEYSISLFSLQYFVRFRLLLLFYVLCIFTYISTCFLFSELFPFLFPCTTRKLICFCSFLSPCRQESAYCLPYGLQIN